MEDTSVRSSSSSSRASQAIKKQTASQQLATIEKSVTHLLVATKQLLETLTSWSRSQATEAQVSDVYVRLGYEFNIACRAFNAIGMETADLGNVPDLLRSILEETLSQEASQASLDKFLPRIRDIIINLLHGLKKKQERIRQRQPAKPGSTETLARTVSSKSSASSTFRPGGPDSEGPDPPPRISSATNGRASPSYGEPRSAGGLNQLPSMESDSSLSSNAMQNIPVIAPYPSEESMPSDSRHTTPYSSQQSVDSAGLTQQPKQDAFLQLQRGGDLERRASRRFSTYQIKQQLGAAANGMPVIPPAQNSPIPNRGREVRESMNAIRSRVSVLHGRKQSTGRPQQPSPNRTLQTPIQEELSTSGLVEAQSTARPSEEISVIARPKVRTRDNEMSATVSGPMFDPNVPAVMPNGDLSPVEKPQTQPELLQRAAKTATPPPQAQQFLAEDSPQPGKPLTLFLQYKSRIKKIVLDGGATDLTIARLQLAFIEKFSWNTHNNGVDLPDIYIQDPVSGVRHELDDISDIKDRAVLVLNIEALDEVKRHIDDGLGGLRSAINEIKTSLSNQQSALDRVSDRQQEAAKELANIATSGPPTSRISDLPSPPSTSSLRSFSTLRSGDGLGEVQHLRRDLAVVRQTYASFVKDVEASMASIRTKAANVKSTAIKVSLPEFTSDTGRAYVTQGKTTLETDSKNIVNHVDTVLDSIEDLRKDVVSRGVRPLPRQLEDVAKDISGVTAELRKMKEFLTKEKPMWTKIWERELANVCEERDMLSMNEDLIVDLEGDLETASKTLELVEEATKQQMNESKGGATGANGAIGPGGLRSTSGKILGLSFDQAVDPRKAHDGMLDEVRALQPNHETSQNRLEAIQRAEKARQRELESRKDGPFKKELGAFVEEGKLKKTGGAEEVERRRKSRDDKIRREVWERLNGIATSLEQEAKADAAAAAAAGNTATPVDDKSDEEVFVEAKEQATDAQPEAATVGMAM